MTAPPVPADFLADLELVCPTRATAGADTFLADLDAVHVDARAPARHRRGVAAADLVSLGESLTAGREHNRRLANYLARRHVPAVSDDTSLRLRNAHTPDLLLFHVAARPTVPPRNAP